MSSTKCLRHSLTYSISRLIEVTIKKLSDEVLLDIFRYYLDASPRSWPCLVHICRKWRRIVSASQPALHLRLFCTHRTPLRKILDCWPASLPIVVEYRGSPGLDPPTPEDEDNIIAVLKQSDRIGSINLTVTNSLLEKLSAIERPFSELEDLVLLSLDCARLTIPSDFVWGPQLRSLYLTRITFFALPQLLRSSRNLVDLRLHEVLNPGLFSPEALTDSLSGMAQLRSLSLHFLPTEDHIGVSQPSRNRADLPALTRLDFRGITNYLEDLVAGIDAPRLGDIEVTFFKNSISDLSRLREFIDRIGIHKSHHQAHILSSDRAISISFIQLGVPTRIKLQVFCDRLSEQLSSMARFCFHFSSFLHDVEDLRISARRQRIWEDGFYSGQWRESMNSFTGVKWFHLDGNSSMNIIWALEPTNGQRETMLPCMLKLCIPQPSRFDRWEEVAVSFMTSRRLSGRLIALEYERLCDISELHGAGKMLLRTTSTTR